MTMDRYGTKFDRLFVTVVTPYKEDLTVDEPALRKLLQYFMQPKFRDAGGAIIINPACGEIFYLTREEKRRNVEIAIEECGGKVPVFAGVFDLRTEDAVKVAIDAKKAGFKIIEIPISHQARPYEDGAGGGSMRTIMPTIRDMIKYKLFNC